MTPIWPELTKVLDLWPLRLDLEPYIRDRSKYTFSDSLRQEGDIGMVFSKIWPTLNDPMGMLSAIFHVWQIQAWLVWRCDSLWGSFIYISGRPNNNIHIFLDEVPLTHLQISIISWIAIFLVHVIWRKCCSLWLVWHILMVLSPRNCWKFLTALTKNNQCFI